MRSLLTRLFQKGRAPRAPRDASVLLFDHRLEATRGRLLNASDTGLGVICADEARLDQATMLLIPQTADAYVIELAWRTGEIAGFRVLRECRLRGFIDAEFEPLKARWEEMLLSDPSIAQPRFFGVRGPG